MSASDTAIFFSQFPRTYESKEAAEAVFKDLRWEYEYPKRGVGMLAHWNHDGRWIGTVGRLQMAAAVVYDQPHSAVVSV